MFPHPTPAPDLPSRTREESHDHERGVVHAGWGRILIFQSKVDATIELDRFRATRILAIEPLL